MSGRQATGAGPGPVRERAVAVFGRRQGSGCLLSAHLVLTAAHVAAEGSEVRAVVPGGTGLQRCEVVWRRYDRQCDAALLRAEQPLVSRERADTLPPLALGWTDEPLSWPQALAVGYPEVQRDAGGALDTEEFAGRLKAGSGLLRGVCALDSHHAPPLPRVDGRSPWAGMSGAPVYVHGMLAGVVREDAAGWGHSRLVVTPVRTLLEGGELVRHSAGSGLRLVLRRLLPPEESAAEAFERRLRSYLAEQSGRLHIIGFSRSGDADEEQWPLDGSYLSLELLDGRDAGAPEAGARPAPQRAEAALAGLRRVLVRGTAGSGKTTLLQWLTVCAARDELPPPLHALRGCVPLLLRLRTLHRRGELPSPEEFLAAVAKPLSGHPGAAGWVTGQLTLGRVLLLIDGVDEVPEADRRRTREWLRELLAAYPDVRYVVTTRPSAVREGWLAAEGFTELELQPMSRRDVARFIGRWHAAAAPAGEEARYAEWRDALVRAVGGKHDLGRLATNPLMCGLVCALNRDRRGFLPESRMELYAAALETLLVRRDRERSIAPGLPLALDQQTLLLQRLAYWLISNGAAEMSRERAEKIVADVLPTLRAVEAAPPAVLDHLMVRSGLLREPTAGTVDFVHRTFQDYLGAQAAVDNGDFGVLVRNAHDDQWRDVLRMAVHHARPRERVELIGGLLARAEREEAVRSRLRLVAAACLEYATSLDPAVREDVTQAARALLPPATVESAQELAQCGPVVLDLLPGPDDLSDEQAHATVVTATVLARDRSIPFLARFARHPHLPVRSQLAWAWDRFDEAEYAESVIARLDESELWFVAKSTGQLSWLRRLGGRRLVEYRGTPGADAERLLASPALEQLELRGSRRPLPLAVLRESPALHGLGLIDSPGGTSLRGIAELRLRRLRAASGTLLNDLDHLARAESLRELTLDVPLRDLTALPPGLRSLALGPEACRRGGLTGLERLAHLEFLDVPGLVVRPGAERGPIARSAVTGLRVTDEDLRRLPESPVLDRVESLHLVEPSGFDDFGAVARVYPGLRTLTVRWYREHEEPVDLAALRRLPLLRTVRVSNAARVGGLDELPPGTVDLVGDRSRSRPRLL